MTKEQIEKMNTQEFILYVDSLSTSDFCDWQGISHPYFTGDIQTSADLFLQVDIVKWRICKEKAKQEFRKDKLSDSELLFAFITEVKKEFADQNWDYLDFIADRVLKSK